MKKIVFKQKEKKTNEKMSDFFFQLQQFSLVNGMHLCPALLIHKHRFIDGFCYLFSCFVLFCYIFCRFHFNTNNTTTVLQTFYLFSFFCAILRWWVFFLLRFVVCDAGGLYNILFSPICSAHTEYIMGIFFPNERKKWVHVMVVFVSFILFVLLFCIYLFFHMLYILHICQLFSFLFVSFHYYWPLWLLTIDFMSGAYKMLLFIRKMHLIFSLHCLLIFIVFFTSHFYIVFGWPHLHDDEIKYTWHEHVLNSWKSVIWKWSF